MKILQKWQKIPKCIRNIWKSAKYQKCQTMKKNIKNISETWLKCKKNKIKNYYFHHQKTKQKRNKCQNLTDQLKNIRNDVKMCQRNVKFLNKNWWCQKSCQKLSKLSKNINKLRKYVKKTQNSSRNSKWFDVFTKICKKKKKITFTENGSVVDAIIQKYFI